MELTCSYSDALKEGSSEVTCLSGIDFSFSEELSCAIAGTTLNFFVKIEDRLSI